MNTKQKDKTYIAATYSRFPVEIVKGKGSTVTDENGKKYIDMGAGIAVNTFGLCDKEWIKAVKKQIGVVVHLIHTGIDDSQTVVDCREIIFDCP